MFNHSNYDISRDTLSYNLRYLLKNIYDKRLQFSHPLLEKRFPVGISTPTVCYAYIYAHLDIYVQESKVFKMNECSRRHFRDSVMS